MKLRPPASRLSLRAAFTLLEVCLAMAVAVLLVGVATLNISGLRQEVGLKRAASRVEALARQSLLRAVTDQKRVIVPLDASALEAAATALWVRRAGEKEFRKPRTGEIWEFSPTGVLEPVEVRLACPEGMIELAFDPLTGCARRRSVVVNG